MWYGSSLSQACLTFVNFNMKLELYDVEGGMDDQYHRLHGYYIDE